MSRSPRVWFARMPEGARIRRDPHPRPSSHRPAALNEVWKHALVELSETEDAAAELAVEAWRRRHCPANEIPASVPVDAVIGSSEGLVVFISALSVYSNGISFTTEARARGGPGSEDRPVSLCDGLLGDVSRHRMLLGVEFPDGRRCISTPRGQDANPKDEPLLLPTRGDGSNGVGSAGWFLSPFPPPGDLRLYCAWPSAGIPETTTLISADELLKAARRVRQLWPPSRIFDQQPTPTPVVLPRDGWFLNSGLTADMP